MNIAVAQFAPALGQLEANLKIVRAFHEQAHQAGADLVVYPELALSGYKMEQKSSRHALGREHPIFLELLGLSERLPLVIGFAERSPRGRIYNAAALLAEGEIVHLHRKVCLPTYGAWEEQKHFAKGRALKVFSYRGFRIALFVCYDFWYPSMTYLAACDDADLMIVLANSCRDPEEYNPRTWELLIQTPAVLYGSYVVFCNRVGLEYGESFWGGSAVIAPRGEVAARAGADETLIYAMLEPDKTTQAREALPLMRDAELDFTARELQRILGQRLVEND